MAKRITIIRETPEEIERKKRLAQAKRFRTIVATLIVCIAARLLIKNPPPPKPPDRSQQKIQYKPGMLEDLPKSALEKMDPKILAQLRRAEADALLARSFGRPEIKGAYKAADAPLPNTTADEAQKQMQFAFATRKAVKIRVHDEKENVDIRKTTVVRFKSGGMIRAEKTVALPAGYEISIDRSLQARMPKQLVTSILPNAANWKEPLRPGFVELKPAKGITIRIAKETAKRITIQKYTYDET